MPDNPARLQRDELLALYPHFQSVIRSELGLFHRYFNFYVGLFSALLAGMLAGMIRVAPGDRSGLVLLAGSLLIPLLSLTGYRSIKVFYYRFAQAWVTALNIESMLGLHDMTQLATGVAQPQYPSLDGGFIAQVMQPELRKIFKGSSQKQSPAEDVVEDLVKTGLTLKHARTVFYLFSGASLILGGVVVVMYGIG